MDIKEIKHHAQSLQEQIVKWRRDLHRIPETGLATVETSKYICARLDEMGIKYETKVGGEDCYSIVASVGGQEPGRCFAVRCDIDALPMSEETGLPFASTNGNMHACGHDAHAAIGLATAKILSERQNEISGSVRIIFQPAEEGCKGGPGGAKRMLDDGVLDGVDAFIGLHVGNIWRSVVGGEIGFRRTTCMACMDRFSLVVKGKGSHGAVPEGSVDPIAISAQIINALQAIVSREISPNVPAVISVCEIHGGSAFNIIPEEVRLQGTIRALTGELRKYLAERIESVAQLVAKSMRATVEYDFNWDGPAPVVNNEAFTREFEEVAAEIVGAERVKELPHASMIGEDVAFFLEKVPGTFFFLPTYDQDEELVYPHHSTKFTIDEKNLWIGAAAMAAMAVCWLERRTTR